MTFQTININQEGSASLFKKIIANKITALLQTAQ